MENRKPNGYWEIRENQNKWIAHDKQWNFTIEFAGNGDCYWALYTDQKNKESSLVVTPDDTQLHGVLLHLYHSVMNKTCAFDENVDFNRQRNGEAHKELVHQNSLVYRSDEHDGTIMKIGKREEDFCLQFETLEPQRKKSIRICLSGSKYRAGYFPFVLAHIQLQAMLLPEKGYEKTK